MNPVLGFLLEYGNVVGEPTQKVYNDFRSWCEDNGHRNIVTRKKFTKEVCYQAGVHSESIRHTYFGEKTGRCFVE